MAEFLPVGPDDAHTAMWLSGLAARDALPALDQLNDPRYVPYRVGHAVWAFLASHYGTRIVGATALDAARSGDPLDAIERTTGASIVDLSRDWQAPIRAQHGGSAATRPGRLLVDGGDGRRVTVNVAPAPSPSWVSASHADEPPPHCVYRCESAAAHVYGFTWAPSRLGLFGT